LIQSSNPSSKRSLHQENESEGHEKSAQKIKDVGQFKKSTNAQKIKSNFDSTIKKNQLTNNFQAFPVKNV